MLNLTNREREVSRLIASGLSNKEIGRALGCTEGTVKVHLVNIFVKLGLRNRTQLAVIAATTGD
jgi:DNA-binding NarL/FixJ family response regulator